MRALIRVTAWERVSLWRRMPQNKFSRWKHNPFAFFYWKLSVWTFFFALCIAPTIVSYAPYTFKWDDSDYLCRSIALSRAFWSANRHELRTAVGTIRPPVMTLMGLPWGPLASWDAAGKCFITLAAFTAFFAACCFFFLLRIGLKPIYLVIASACVFAALGPYPAGAEAHFHATSFMADNLFAWNAFAALLLIPYEATISPSSTRGSLARGFLWAVIFSVGAITKVSFFYFIVLAIPVLFVVRMRHSGLRSALLSLSLLIVCSLPATIYWLRYGRTAFKYGHAASFGPTALHYYSPLSQFVTDIFRQSPGLLLSGLFVIAGVLYLMFHRRDLPLGTNILPIPIMIGYCTITLVSSNREIRFSFPAIIALPFLMGILISGKTALFPRRSAMMASILVFCCIVAASIPMLHRANKQSIAKSEAVLAQAAESNAKRVLLATDSTTLNEPLMRLAITVSPSLPPVETDALSWQAALGRPIEEDFSMILESDLVVFQNAEALDSPATNQRVSEYEQYTREHFSNVPIKVVDGICIYSAGHNKQYSTHFLRMVPD
jgi:hypothetical protein